MTQTADHITDVIDGVTDKGIDVVEQVLVNKALLAILGTIAGPWATILTPIIKLVLRKCGIYQALRLGKRKMQLAVDVVDSYIVIRSIDKALAEDDIDEIKDIYANSY